MTKRDSNFFVAWVGILAAGMILLADEVELRVSVKGPRSEATATAETTVSFPGECNFLVFSPTTPWTEIGTLNFELYLPEDGPTNAQVLVYVQDWEYFWYQKLLPGFPRPGVPSAFRVDFSPTAPGWESQGHHGTWHLRTLLKPREVGIRVFCATPYRGSCRIGKIGGTRRKDRSPPFIRSVRANAVRVKCFEKFELQFLIPDRHADPFDNRLVSVTALFETPDKRTVTVDGFYTRDYYRKKDELGEEVRPQGGPYWCVRFAPTIPGVYRYHLRVRDETGETQWGPGTFEALPPEKPGFVRVSRRDPRWFEFDDGTFFFPVGHNIRSPFDARMDKQFPWRQRWPEGSSAYQRYFDAMRRHGENMTEVWMAAWSLGLEWSEDWPGYYGIGQYNLRNAWELDRVLEAAESNGIYVNLVIHNHGKFSSWCDPEWDTNPFNVRNGGYLERPELYFSDPRALEAFRKLMRYVVARWAYSTHIFAWELWSELDLAGSQFGTQNLPQVVDWHDMMSLWLKQTDPNSHMITTHVCCDYTHQNPRLISLPGISFAAVDAYHGSGNPVHIVHMMRQTAEFNNPFRKPVLITEFGGSAMAQGLEHLKDALHCALWASTCLPVGGTPLFWWWQLVEEENIYPIFLPVREFLKGDDLRDPSLVSRVPQVLQGNANSSRIAALALQNDRRAVGWVYLAEEFDRVEPTGVPVITNAVLRLEQMAEGTYRAEYWDTVQGRPNGDTHASANGGVLLLKVPPFARDIAFKVNRVRE
ncbi:MAG: DUF5060 domain-containing protein [Kiritimatiellae bacterium]|nr:DUF5060 domain-containing protein [Kiritimatiellia bacterium]